MPYTVRFPDTPVKVRSKAGSQRLVDQGINVQPLVYPADAARLTAIEMESLVREVGGALERLPQLDIAVWLNWDDRHVILGVNGRQVDICTRQESYSTRPTPVQGLIRYAPDTETWFSIFLSLLDPLEQLAYVRNDAAAGGHIVATFGGT